MIPTRHPRVVIAAEGHMNGTAVAGWFAGRVGDVVLVERPEFTERFTLIALGLVLDCLKRLTGSALPGICVSAGP
jgi:hypothetical protein